MRRFAPWLVTGAVLASCAGGPSLGQVQSATGDVVKDLRASAAHAEAALPLMRLTCAAIKADAERALCVAVVARVEGALPKAKDILARVDACTGQDDEPECIYLAVDGANVILRELQGEAPAPAASSAAPVGSAAP